jgi:thioredoxin 1
MIATDSNFQEVLDQQDLVLIDFWAEWCGPCKKVSPILDEISLDTGILVGKLNVDENPKKMEEYSVHSIPTMVLFKSGQPVKTIVGAKPKHVLLKELAEWMI